MKDKTTKDKTVTKSKDAEYDGSKSLMYADNAIRDLCALLGIVLRNADEDNCDCVDARDINRNRLAPFAPVIAAMMDIAYKEDTK